MVINHVSKSWDDPPSRGPPCRSSWYHDTGWYAYGRLIAHQHGLSFEGADGWMGVDDSMTGNRPFLPTATQSTKSGWWFENV